MVPLCSRSGKQVTPVHKKSLGNAQVVTSCHELAGKVFVDGAFLTGRDAIRAPGKAQKMHIVHCRPCCDRDYKLHNTRTHEIQQVQVVYLSSKVPPSMRNM